MTPTIDTLITICARGGSKGIPGKNIRPVGGRPLLAYTAAMALAYADMTGAPVVLSTDSPEILAEGAKCGLPTDYVRPEALANDTAGKPAAIAHAMLWAEQRYGVRFETVIDLDVTSPLRTLADIEAVHTLLLDHPDALTAFSVSPAGRNPYFNMVREDPDGYARVILGGRYTTRQSAPKVYDMNASIYAYRREALTAPDPRAVTDRSLAYVMDHKCFDLDEPEDFDYLTWLVDTNRVKLLP